MLRHTGILFGRSDMVRTHRVGLSLLLFLLLAPTLSAQLNRHLQISTPRIDFDTLCGEVECRDITLVNISTAPIEILSLTTPQVPFSQNATPPFVPPVTIPFGWCSNASILFFPHDTRSCREWKRPDHYGRHWRCSEPGTGYFDPAW